MGVAFFFELGTVPGSKGAEHLKKCVDLTVGTRDGSHFSLRTGTWIYNAAQLAKFCILDRTIRQL